MMGARQLLVEDGWIGVRQLHIVLFILMPMNILDAYGYSRWYKWTWMRLGCGVDGVPRMDAPTDG